jgi:hypothetical protein
MACVVSTWPIFESNMLPERAPHRAQSHNSRIVRRSASDSFLACANSQHQVRKSQCHPDFVGNHRVIKLASESGGESDLCGCQLFTSRSSDLS